MRTSIQRYRKSYLSVACVIPVLLIMQVTCIHAQVADTFALYIAPNASLYMHANSNMSVKSNVINSGVVASKQSTTLNMYGDIWRNTAGSSIIDETGGTTGTGGVFRFAGSFPQYISGGFSVSSRTGVSFPNLVLSNSFGLYLQEDTQVRGILQLENGVLWLSGSNLLIGNTDPGAITNYSANNFIGTGNTVKGGYLYRAKVSASSGGVVFPIGTQVGSYAPIMVLYNTSTPQDLHARVFDDIYSNAFQGTKGSPASLQQTWNIGQENTTRVPSIIAFQHDQSHEGAAFSTHRGSSYVSMYDFILHTWDTLPPSVFSTPGTLTTAAPQNGTFINNRAFDSLGQTMYLTKTIDARTDSVILNKLALTPVRQSDGSFLITYLFFVRNTSALFPAKNIQVYDTLDKVFPAPSSFSVISVTSTGKLVPDISFDGSSQTNLLQSVSSVDANTTDTITLTLNAKPAKLGVYYYNTAVLDGTINGFNNTPYVFSNPSVNGVGSSLPGAASVPTPLILSASTYQMPEGFSPNGDGVNDKLIIGNLGSNNAALWVFNKQGTLVYRNMNYKNDWDGTYNQSAGGSATFKKVEDGTYFYKAVITDSAGKQETYYGYLSIWK